jgi:hypothetical protein
MIISPQRNFIFIHLYKCGGTSVERAYEKISLWDDLILGSTEFGENAQNYYNRRFGLHKHSFVRGIVNALGEERYLSMETFALVRNPFRVYESLYGWIAGMYRGAARDVSVEELKAKVRSGEAEIPFRPAAIAYAHSEDFYGFMEYFQRHRLPFEPMSDSLMLDDSRLGVQHVYRLEELGLFRLHFERVAGGPLERLHLNKSSGAKIDWHPRHREWISAVHGRDLQHFGYRFD